jgi:hypothetical protein
MGRRVGLPDELSDDRRLQTTEQPVLVDVARAPRAQGDPREQRALVDALDTGNDPDARHGPSARGRVSELSRIIVMRVWDKREQSLSRSGVALC